MTVPPSAVEIASPCDVHGPSLRERLRPHDADPAFYGLDIETDTSVDGLDPTVAAVVAVAIASAGPTVLFRGDEGQILAALADHVRRLPVGIITTWNGTSFDLPFLAERALRLGIDIGLDGWRSDIDPAAAWLGHRHVAGYRLYRSDVGRALPVSCGLKRMARLVGLDPVEVDAARIHELDADVIDRYVASDAELARALLIRRWPVSVSAV